MPEENSSPEKTYELKFAALAPEVWEALDKIPRTGWVRRGVKSPESIQGHIVALRQIAIRLFSKLQEFSDEDKESLVNMLEVHDWPEALHGDEVIVTNDKEKKRELKTEKFKNELVAMAMICDSINGGGEIMELWLRFEKGGDPVSYFGKQLDKYQAIEKALEYEQNGETVSTQEFIDYAEKDFTHPVILEELSKVKDILAGLKGQP